MEIPDFFPNNVLPHDEVQFPTTPDPKTSPVQDRSRRRVESISFWHEQTDTEHSMRRSEMARDALSFVGSAGQRSLMVDEHQAYQMRLQRGSSMVEETIPVKMNRGMSRVSNGEKRKVSSPELSSWNSGNHKVRSEDYEMGLNLHSIISEGESLDFYVMDSISVLPRPKTIIQANGSEGSIQHKLFEAYQSTLFSYKIALDEIAFMQAELANLRKASLRNDVCRCEKRISTFNGDKNHSLQVGIGKRHDPVENPCDTGMEPFKKIKNTIVSKIEFGNQSSKTVPMIPSVHSQILPPQVNGKRLHPSNLSQTESPLTVSYRQQQLPWKPSIELDEQLQKLHMQNREKFIKENRSQLDQRHGGFTQNTISTHQNGQHELGIVPTQLTQRPDSEHQPAQPVEEQASQTGTPSPSVLTEVLATKVIKFSAQVSRPASPSLDNEDHRHRFSGLNAPILAGVSQRSSGSSTEHMSLHLHDENESLSRSRPASPTENNENHRHRYLLPPPATLTTPSQTTVPKTTQQDPRRPPKHPQRPETPTLPSKPQPHLHRPEHPSKQPPQQSQNHQNHHHQQHQQQQQQQEHTHRPPRRLRAFTPVGGAHMLDRDIKAAFLPPTKVLEPPPLVQPSPVRNPSPADSIRVKLSPRPMFEVISLCDSDEEIPLSLKELLPPNLQTDGQINVVAPLPERVKVSESDSGGDQGSVEPRPSENDETVKEKPIQQDSGINAIFAKYSGSSIQIDAPLSKGPLQASTIVFPDSKLT